MKGFTDFSQTQCRHATRRVEVIASIVSNQFLATGRFTPMQFINNSGKI